MKREWKNNSPALLAVLTLLIVEIIKLLGAVTQGQWYNFEIISNSVMLLIALGGFLCLGLPFREKGGCLNVLLSNMSVSGIAFLMNIYVFEHSIHREQLLEDLWHHHMLWVICIIVQLLFLTGAGTLLSGLFNAILKCKKC